MNNHFVYNPSTVDIKRSKFLIPSFWKGHMFHGDLVPLEIIKVMPGDSIKYDLSCFVRTATPPIAPFMDSVTFSIAAFNVPERLVWGKEKEFVGENTEGYGIQTEIKRPRTTNGFMYVNKSNAVASFPHSMATYLGLVRQKTDTLTSPSPISLNPLRAYLQVYNDWFRNENFMAPYLWDHSQTGDASRNLATLGGVGVNGTSDVPKVCKQLDRYTSCLPWAQKGQSVALPLGNLAPVITGDINTDLATKSSESTTGLYVLKSGVKDLVLANNLDNATGPYTLYAKQNESFEDPWTLQGKTGGTEGSYLNFVPVNQYADLSKATAANVNQLRLSFATQRYLEALARSGSKYREYIKGMFSVNIGDTTAQMAEYLGGISMELNVDQVLQTTDYAAGSTTKLGAPGASSTSATSGYLFTKSIVEPGYLVIVGYTKHKRTYGQGIDEMWQDNEILQDYNPKFANIGEQAIRSSNLYFSGEEADDDDRFGFQEAWSQYRFIKDKVIGFLAPSNTSAYNFWSLADKYDTKPTLNADFLTEDRTNISRCLSGGSSAPDYFVDIKFNRTFVRPMPLYSIPGLIDHH